MKMRGSGLAAALGLAICLHLPAPAVAQEPGVRRLALVDFAVRAPAGLSENLTWFGPAVSELLQAKMQLFGEARVLERQRVGALLREAKADAGAAVDDPGALSGILPAEVLIAGSVSVDPQVPQRIRVQARAFEVGTSKIVSEAAFSGTGDLAGLLRIAEDLAKSLADGLKLAYTLEQLAYAEPAKIDTLRLYIDGEEHLGALRYREAIESFQKALDENGGRYYAAAHRLQGEAYQALAKSKSGPEAQQVNKEYLKKVKEDALIASGALFDLGLAYEANGMWQEAGTTFQDYVTDLGSAGNPVRWKVNTGIDYGNVMVEDNRLLHYVGTKQTQGGNHWETREAETGKLVGKISLKGIFPVRSPQEITDWSLKGIDDGKYVFLYRSQKSLEYRYSLAVLGKQGQVLWVWPLEMEQIDSVRVRCAAGRVYLGVVPKTGKIVQVTADGLSYSKRDKPGYLYTFAAADGRLLSTVALENNFISNIDMRNLDLTAGTYNAPEGSHDLSRNSFLPYDDKPVLEKTKQGWAEWKIPRPTGCPGISYIKEKDGVRLYRDGREILFLPQGEEIVWPPSFDVYAEPAPIFEGPLLFRKDSGYLLVNPRDWTVISLYQDYQGEKPPVLVGRNASRMAFYVYQDQSAGQLDSHYGLPNAAVVLNVFDSRTGRLEVKYRSLSLASRLLLLGDDYLLFNDHGVQRVGFTKPSILSPAAATDAGLHIARCRLEQGDRQAAAKALDALGQDATLDSRGLLLRLRLANLGGAVDEAATYALKALAGGGVEDKPEVELCLEAIKKNYPEVQGLLRIPIKGRLEFQTMAAPGQAVAVLKSYTRCEANFLIDLTSGSTRLTYTPELNAYCANLPSRLLYSGKYIFGPLPLENKQEGVVRVDLSTGRRIQSPPLGREITGKVRGMNVGVVVWGEDQRRWLVHLDPENLQVLNRIDLGYAFLLSEENGLGFFTEIFHEGGDVPIIIIDLAGGREVFRTTLSLRKEKIIAATSDGSTLYVGIAGGDYEALIQGAKALWLRVEAIPIGPRGKRWTFEGEGFLAGNLLLEGDGISFPAYEGKLSVEIKTDKSGKTFETIRKKSLPLKKLTLHKATGVRQAEEPLRINPWDTEPVTWRTAAHIPEGVVRSKRGMAWDPEGGPDLVMIKNDGSKGLDLDRIITVFDPPALRSIFAGSRNSVWYREGTGRFWNYRDDREPLPVVAGGPGQDYCIIRSVFGTIQSHSTMLVEKGRMYESIGGGYILVKDDAGGKGLDDIYPPWK